MTFAADAVGRPSSDPRAVANALEVAKNCASVVEARELEVERNVEVGFVR